MCNLKGRFLRKKKWDYWCILGNRFLFSATIAHVDYMALAAIYFLEYETKRFAEQIVAKPFARRPKMPETVTGPIHFKGRGLRISFDPAETGLHMTVSSSKFGGRPFAADLTIERPEGHESLNVVVPWNATTFQFTSKQHCLPTTGTLEWGKETLAFEQDRAFATLDYGRGIWPYRTAWNWGTFSGRSGPDTVGINIGAKWTDNTGMNENGIFLNGRLHKVFDDIRFDYDRADFMAPWTIKTVSTDAVDLRLTPFYDKASAANLLILRSDAHQVFGHYSGTLQVDGRAIHIENVVGWAEEHVARW